MNRSMNFFALTLVCLQASYAFATEQEGSSDSPAPAVQGTTTSRQVRPTLLPGANGSGYFLTRDSATAVQELSAADFYKTVGRQDLHESARWRSGAKNSFNSLGVGAVLLGSALALAGILSLNPSQKVEQQSAVSVASAVTGVGTMLGGLTSIAIAWLIGDDKLDSAEAKSLAAAYNNRPE